MKTLNINNSKVTTLDNYCDTTLEINSNSSNIRTLNIFNSLSSLSGKYNCNINIYDSTYLYLKDSFILNYKSICFIGDNLSPLNITIEGKLNNLSNSLNISSFGDINFTSKLSSNNISKTSLIKIFLNSKNKYLSSFSLNDSLPNTEDTIPIILYSKNSRKLIINSDVKSIDFTGSKDIEFTIMPNKTVSYFINVKKNTFKFLNTTLDSLLILKNQYSNIIFKINSLVLNTSILDGKGTVLLPKNAPKLTGVSILIQNSEFPLKNNW